MSKETVITCTYPDSKVDRVRANTLMSRSINTYASLIHHNQIVIDRLINLAHQYDGPTLWYSISSTSSNVHYCKTSKHTHFNLNTVADDIARKYISINTFIGNIKHSNDIIKSHINKINKFKKRLDQDKLTYKDSCLITTKKNDGQIVISLLYLPHGNLCKLCHRPILPDRVKKHQQSRFCKDKARFIRVEKLGLSPTSDQKLINAIADHIIDGEGIPIKYKWYAPRWAITAAEVYNKSWQSYADMTFAEFISRAKPS